MGLRLPEESVVVHEQGGEGFLLQLQTGEYFGLNRAGLVAWRALEEQRDPISALADAFPDVPREQLAADWDALRRTLIDNRLLEQTG